MTKQKKLIEDDDFIPNENLDKSPKNNNKDNEEEEEEDESEDSDLEEFNPGHDYRSLQSVVTYEDEEYIYMNKLNDMIDKIFQESRWTIINPHKKIPKDLIPLIFQDILEKLESSEFTMVEKFVAVCDYTAINYQKAYESIHMKYKEMIVQEMDKKYKILQKKGIKKIF